MKAIVSMVLLAAALSVPLAGQTLTEQLQKGIYTEEMLGIVTKPPHLPSDHRGAGRAAGDRAGCRATARAADRLRAPATA